MAYSDEAWETGVMRHYRLGNGPGWVHTGGSRAWLYCGSLLC